MRFIVAAAAALAASGCVQDPPAPEEYMAPAAAVPEGRDPAVAPGIDPRQEERLQRERELEEITPERRRIFFPPAREEPSYRLRVNDLVEIKAYNAAGQPLPIEDVTKSARIFLDGSVTLGFLGHVQAAGMKPEEFGKVLTDHLQEYVHDPRVTVNVTEFTKDRVTILGGFAKTGSIEFTPPRSLLQILSDAGWDPKNESQGRVLLVRGGLPLAVDVGRLLAEQDFEHDPQVRNGDIVTLVSREPIVLLGETMSRPRFEIPGQARIDLSHALLLAGGVTFQADLASATLLRSDGRQYALDLNAYFFDGSPDSDPGAVILYPGDVVVLPATSEKSVFVFGVVDKPGNYKFTGSISVLHALALANPREFNADVERVALVRGFPTSPSVTWIDLDEVLEEGAANPAVRDGDIVFVPRKGFLDVLDYVNRTMAPASGAASLPPAYGYQPLRLDTIHGRQESGGGVTVVGN